MPGLALTAVFGFVAFVLSYRFFVPSDLKSLNFIAAVASMAGSALGKQVPKAARRLRSVLIFGSAVVCVACVILYVVYVQRGSGDLSDVILLAVLLFGIFFTFTLLMPLAGIAIKTGPEDGKSGEQ